MSQALTWQRAKFGPGWYLSISRSGGPCGVTVAAYKGGQTVKRSRMLQLPIAMLAALGLLFAYGPGASAAPGNNGTVKIDGVAFDDYPNNEPHPDCFFQVDFYNYEQGNFNASVKFIVQPPTGKDIVLLTDSVFIGGDAAGGGTDLDGSGTYDLGAVLQAFMAHPQQGYHIKLKVNAPHSIGKDTKYKVFWVTRCSPY